MSGTMATLIAEHDIIVCAGPGGVGKTTAAAAIALEGARRGRRTCVVTIDPARRLADALGIAALGNDPHQVEGTWEGPGELWALMLDTKATFDSIVKANASSPAQAQAILANRFYRNISGALSGTQEYMAMEKLYALHNDSRFDLVVVDTPPTRHALDFLDAPNRLMRFLNNRIFRVLMTPTRAGLRAVNVATQMVLRTISRVVGGEVVTDAVAFFTAFEGMEQGFRDRAGRMETLLAEKGTAFIVVAAPRRDAVDEATFFADRLRQTKMPVAALIMNRVLPRFGTVPAQVGQPGPLADLITNLSELDGIAQREEHHIDSLARRLPGTPVIRVPMLVGEVHDMGGLNEVGRALLEGD
ncbi:MAG: AAA family ATPase [Actinomycetota bacterium]|nr:AAA family ATPase [Actinomycetota bacterium]